MDQDLRLYRLLGLMAGQGVGFRYQDGEFRTYTEEFAYGVTARLEIRLRPDGSHTYYVDHRPADHDHFMSSVRESTVDKLRAMELALEWARRRPAGDDLVELLMQGWRFPDDGRASFSWVRYPGGEKVAGVVYLDSRNRLAYELAGQAATRAELIAWVGGPAAEFARVESLLQQLADEA